MKQRIDISVLVSPTASRHGNKHEIMRGGPCSEDGSKKIDAPVVDATIRIQRPRPEMGSW